MNRTAITVDTDKARHLLTISKASPDALKILAEKIDEYEKKPTGLKGLEVKLRNFKSFI